MKCDNQISIKFLSKSVNEGFARSAVACFAAQLDPTIDELGDIKTAVSEAVTNSIVHGYPDVLGWITVICKITEENTLDILVKDKGKGIDNIDLARQPMYTTGGQERSGMGFTIMESFMHSLKVTSTPGKGTTVHMKRKILKRGKRVA